MAQNKSNNGKNVSRRSFGKTAAGAGMAALASAPFPSSVIGANDRINMGAIGIRGMGGHNSRELAKIKNVKFTDVCDVDHREREKFQNQFADQFDSPLEAHNDFRTLLDKPHLDAVTIGTPDHWHALPFVYACERGIDIYCEKPISHNIVEGRAMVNAAKKFERVVQIGSWQRSVQHFQDAIDFVRSGKLGDISVCRAWINSNSNGIGHQPPSTPPDHLDWDMWLGPAPYKLFHENQYHWNWRWFFDYAGGQTADWGVHMMDILCLAMGQWDPIEVSSFGGTFVLDDDRDTPDTQIAIYKFPNFVLHWEVRWGNGRGLDGFDDQPGCAWIGRNAEFGVNRSRWQVFPEGKGDNLRLEDEPETINEIKESHHQNFVDCIYSRKRPRSDIETMHKTTVLCHLANIAFRTGKKLEWDSDREIITNEPSAMNCPQFNREYRSPWRLPIHKV